MSDEDREAAETEPEGRPFFLSARFYLLLALIVFLVVFLLENTGTISVIVLIPRIVVKVGSWSLGCFLAGLIVGLLLRGRQRGESEGE